MSTRFGWTSCPLPDLAWLRLDGELDVAAGGGSLRALADAGADAATVVLDARGLSFCDTSGVRALSRLTERWAVGGREVCVIPSRAVERISELTGLLRLEEITHPLEEMLDRAVASAGARAPAGQPAPAVLAARRLGTLVSGEVARATALRASTYRLESRRGMAMRASDHLVAAVRERRTSSEG
jgi:anti-anti-sigma factor